jgi:hypothetical protein
VAHSWISGSWKIESDACPCPSRHKPVADVSQIIHAMGPVRAALALLLALALLALAAAEKDFYKARNALAPAVRAGMPATHSRPNAALDGRGPHTRPQILELQRDATDDQIKRAFRKLSLKFHPDKARSCQHAHAQGTRARARRIRARSSSTWT